MATLKCIAYINQKTSVEGSPLYEVTIQVDGDESLVESIKDSLTSISIENLPLKLESIFKSSDFESEILPTGIMYTSKKDQTKNVELRFDVLDTTKDLTPELFSQYVKFNRANLKSSNPTLPLISPKFDNSITFLPQDVFDDRFNTDNHSSRVAAIDLQNKMIYIRLYNDPNSNYREELKNIKKYIIDRMLGRLLTTDERYEMYVDSILHEQLHPSIRSNPTYQGFLDMAFAYNELQKSIVKDLPNQFADLKNYYESDDLRSFFEEVFVYYNTGVKYFVDKLKDLDSGLTPSEDVTDTQSPTEPTMMHKETSELDSDFDKLFKPRKFKSAKHTETLKQIQYKPYTRVVDNNPNIIANLQRNDIIYVRWSGKSFDKELVKAYFVSSIEQSGSNFIIKAIGVNDSSSTDDETILTEKTIVIRYDSVKEDFISDLVAFRKYSGISRYSMDSVGVLMSIDKKRLWQEIQQNVADYRLAKDRSEKAIAEKKELTNIPKFIHFESNDMYDSQRDAVGFYIHVGGNVEMRDIKPIIKSESAVQGLSSANQESLNDATFALLKQGDIVEYRVSIYKNNSFVKTERITGVITNKFSEGVTVQRLDSFNDKKHNAEEDIPVNKKDLFSAYIFFNANKKQLDKSNVLDDLDAFRQASREIDERYSDRTLSPQAFSLKHLKDITDTTIVHKFRNYESTDNKTWKISNKPNYYYPGSEAINFVFEGKALPSDTYQDFEKAMNKLPQRTQYYFMQTQKDELKIQKLNLSKSDTVWLNSMPKEFFAYYNAVQNRKQLIAGLKLGAYVEMNNKQMQKVNDEWVEKESRRTQYGVIISKSDRFLGVAIQNLEWVKVEDKWESKHIGWKFVEINFTDLRPDKRYDITRIGNNIGFENNLFSLLETVRYVGQKTYKEKNAPKSTAQLQTEVESIINRFASQGIHEFAESKDLVEVESIGSVWHKIDFFSANDYNNENELKLSAQEIQQRNDQRVRYVAMLETGSIVTLRISIKDKDGTDKYYHKAYIVVGKNLQTGLPILTTVKHGKEYSEGGKVLRNKYLDTFEPDIDRITGVGLIMQKRQVHRTDWDGSEMTLTLDENEAFRKDIAELMKEFQEKTIASYFDNLASAEEYITEQESILEKRFGKYREAMRQANKPFFKEELIQRKVHTMSKQVFQNGKFMNITKDVFTEELPKYKNWEEIGVKYAIFEKINSTGEKTYYKKYLPNSYRARFVAGKDRKFQVPKYMSVVDKIKRGTIIEFQAENYKYPMRGMVLSKDARSLTLLIPNNKDAEWDHMNFEDVKIWKLFFRAQNLSNVKNKPQWVAVLPGVREIQFTDDVDKEEFRILKELSKAWRSDKSSDYGQMIHESAIDLGVLENKQGVTLSQVHYRKNDLKASKGISAVNTTINVEELRKYQNKFESMYGVKFKFLTTTEIAEEYDNRSDFFGEKVSGYRAFKFGNEVIMNIDLATLEEPFHEMTHFVLEAMRINDPDQYTNLMSLIQTHPLYNQIQMRYPGKFKSDLDEEVFSTVLGMVYSTKVKSDAESEWEDVNKSKLEIFLDWVRDLLRKLFGGHAIINNSTLVNSPMRDILLQFGEDLDSGKFQSYIHPAPDKIVEDLKKRLFENGNLKTYCQ